MEEVEEQGNENISESNSDFVRKIKKNPWIISTIALGAIVIILLVVNFSGMTGKVISGDDAGNSVVEFINANTNAGLTYVSSEDLGNLYRVIVLYQGQQVPVYVTKDGKYYTTGATPITTNVVNAQTQQQNQQPQNVPKSDKPKIELFVMTHCPYGIQAEKGLIPAIKALGNSIDASIRFVHYFMHGDKEETETYNQVCIREEQASKYLDYLECFLEDGDSARCVQESKIDKNKLESCVKTKAKDYYVKDSESSKGYDVQGSPTLVVNGEQVSSARDSASFLKIICSAFNTSPAECEQELSSASPSPGFGSAVSAPQDASHPSTATGGSCA